MCGIFAYVGDRPCAPLLFEGLKRLEYRGYDSAGIATVHKGKILFSKEKGRVEQLNNHLTHLHGTTGVAHTRWATHGSPSKSNAHPHTSGHITIVHNGIIENFEVLKSYLQEQGYAFQSETDSEVIAHLIHHLHKDNQSLEIAFKEALLRLEGAYGIVALSSKEPKHLFVARNGSPLVIGISDNECFAASDPSALIEHTRAVMYLEDGTMGVLAKDDHHFSSIKDGNLLQPETSIIDWDVEQIKKGGYSHFMLKEIFEQPKTVSDAFAGRLKKILAHQRLSSLNLKANIAVSFNRVLITACGTSWHAGLVAKQYFEHFTGLPTEVDYASELRYRDSLIDDKTLVVVISQSGETADTLEALKSCKQRGAFTIGAVNVVGSTIARLVDGGLYLHAGPEVGVASTKAFTTQLVVLLTIAVQLALLRGKALSQEIKTLFKDSVQLPALVEETLSTHDVIKSIAPKFKEANNALYLGRGLHFPVALEGALKLKEISYIHAEGLPAAEMKHGPIALIDKEMPVVVCIPDNELYKKVLSNIQEVKARGGKVVAIASKEDASLSALADYVVVVPKTHKFLQPILSIIPLQLLAYELAVLRGCDVDKPRNLAKSVTVE